MTRSSAGTPVSKHSFAQIVANYATNHDSAREAGGFTLGEEEAHPRLWHDLVGQNWSRDL